jgi:hypothetical protein
VSEDFDQTETAPNGEQAPMVYPGKEERGRFKASDYVLLAARMRVTACYSGAVDDLRRQRKLEEPVRARPLLPSLISRPWCWTS